jgi:hypothetical protein
MGLCPSPEVYRFAFDGGGFYTPSALQDAVWGYWQQFWTEFVPMANKGEEFAVVINGDAIDGRHHGSTTQITQNIAGQLEIASACIKWALNQFDPRPPLYYVRGTEAHVGPSGENEETLAQALCAVPDEAGNASRFELRLRVGKILVDIQHHISTVGSNAYETTALNKEYVIACEEAGRWGQEPPDVIVRGHRHRQAQIEVPSEHGSGIVVTTAGWQLKTPFTYRLAGARQAMPQFGGVLVRDGAEHIYTKHRTWSVERSQIETLP